MGFTGFNCVSREWSKLHKPIKIAHRCEIRSCSFKSILFQQKRRETKAHSVGRAPNQSSLFQRQLTAKQVKRKTFK